MLPSVSGAGAERSLKIDSTYHLIHARTSSSSTSSASSSTRVYGSRRPQFMCRRFQPFGEADQPSAVLPKPVRQPEQRGSRRRPIAEIHAHRVAVGLHGVGGILQRGCRGPKGHTVQACYARLHICIVAHIHRLCKCGAALAVAGSHL